MSNRRDIVIGFLNPLVVYPAPLLALVATRTGYSFRYPDGSMVEVSVEQENLRQWSRQLEITLLADGHQILLSRHELLYGISADHVVVGKLSAVNRELHVYLGSSAISPAIEETLLDFVTQDGQLPYRSVDLDEIRQRLGLMSPYVRYRTEQRVTDAPQPRNLEALSSAIAVEPFVQARIIPLPGIRTETLFKRDQRVLR